MAFPNTPTDGDEYTAPSGTTYTYTASNNTWTITQNNTDTATSSTTAPTTPSIGQEWFNTADSRWYKWTVDGAASAWVDISG